MSMIKKNQTKNRREKIALSEQQIKQLLKTIIGENKKFSQRNALMLRLWLSVGFRVSEICNLQVHWIKGKKGSYVINIQSNGKPLAFMPKYGSSRRIAISNELHKDIKSYLAGRKTGYVFKSQKTKYYGRLHDKNVITMFNDYFKKTETIGRSLGTHTFRRTFASQLANSDPPLSLTKISYYLGHKHISTTIIYLKHIKNDDHSDLLNSNYIKNMTDMMNI